MSPGLILDKLTTSLRARGLAGTTRLLVRRLAARRRKGRKDREYAKRLEALAGEAGPDGSIVRTIHGSRMRLDVRPGSIHSLERTLAVRGTREPASTDYYVARLGALRSAWQSLPPALVLDVGANVGYFTLLQARILGERARVVAVEAEEENARRLEHNVRLNTYGNIEVLQVAAGAAAGTGALDRRDRSNVHRMAEVSRAPSDLQPVEVVTIDDLVSRFAPDAAAPVVVRMDVEGYEGFVFEGMRKLLASRRPCYMFFEVHKAASPWLPAIVEALDRGGFALERLDPTQGSGDGLVRNPAWSDLIGQTSPTHVFCRRGVETG